MTISCFAATASKDIPRALGIYAFFLDLVSPSKIGLAGRGPWTDEHLTRAREALLDRCNLQAKVYSSIQFTGNISERDKHPHLTRSLSIEAWPIAPQLFEDISTSLPLNSVRTYASVLHASFMLNPPVYVGITQKQTLRERYNQHRADYQGGLDVNTFGGRLLASGIEWDDVIFACIPFQETIDDAITLPKLERHLQAVTTPILSIR
ncbi:hypothetical protein [Burkholderia cenocepacia]|uniref:hypothetical protein n=1 Tax=Burkholderia cenocepacia TaxID=95486 RepID=UPI00222E23FA|nr:hypothetical protein [Burkholderia cenocepacia]MCW3610737.1 hypothetical protein [Burkholderia cenocepacia]MCW5189290.1 hypothetical protein [Burkholderia cenocepacia]